jgi:hypothetical protein
MPLMRPSRYVLLAVALLVPSCKTGGPKAGPTAPAPPADLLRPYEGALRLLPGSGDQRTLALKTGERPADTCAVAVRVRSLAFAGGTVRFALDTIGTPRIGERGASCRRVQPAVQLALTGFAPGAVTPAVTSRIDEVLQTPEAYLQAHGTRFDRAPEGVPSDLASQQADADAGERQLARSVVAWPRALLSVDPLYHDPAGRVRYQGLVEIEAVVGRDGRLYRGRVKTSLSSEHEKAILAVLPLWRFEPARRADGPVAARIPLGLTFRVY